MQSIREVQQLVESGKHLAWNEAVDILKNGKTPWLNLIVEEAFLIVAFDDGNSDWGLVTSTLTKENPLEAVAAMYQEGPVALILGDGTCGFIKLDGHSSEPSALPVGLAFIGKYPDGLWGDEFAGVHVGEIAAMLGRSKEEELGLLSDFVFESAKDRIARRTAD